VYTCSLTDCLGGLVQTLYAYLCIPKRILAFGRTTGQTSFDAANLCIISLDRITSYVATDLYDTAHTHYFLATDLYDTHTRYFLATDLYDTAHTHTLLFSY